MSEKSKPKVTTTTVLTFSLPILAIAMGKLTGTFSGNQQFEIYFIAVVFSIFTSGAGYLILREFFKIPETATEINTAATNLLDSIKETKKQQALLVSNESLKQIEQKADLIRIISPDLHDDNHIFFETIARNISEKKRYEYIIQNSTEPKMKQLKAKIKNHLKIQNIDNFLNYKKVDSSNYPIVTAYGIYFTKEMDVRGFVEVKIGKKYDDTSHIELEYAEALLLNDWFETLFEK